MTTEGQPHPSAPSPQDHGVSRVPDAPPPLTDEWVDTPPPLTDEWVDTPEPLTDERPDAPPPLTDERPDTPPPLTDERPDTPPPLTDEWVAWLAAKLSGCRVDSDTDLIVEHRVADADGDEFCWHVRVEDGAVQVAAGPADETAPGPGVVTFASDAATARAVAVEGASAQRAFLEGRLRLSGDVRLLISARPALTALAEAAGRPA